MTEWDVFKTLDLQKIYDAMQVRATLTLTPTPTPDLHPDLNPDPNPDPNPNLNFDP